MMTIQEIVSHVKSESNQKRIADDYDRYKVYNGKLRDLIRSKIAKEFTKPETIEELCSRIVPINITQKIVNKLAMVYMQNPTRGDMEKNPGNEELVDLYAPALRCNINGKIANRYFKLFKHAAWEPYLDSDGVPRLRTLPSHTYTPISTDPKEPHKPNIFVKHMCVHEQPENERYAIWTNDQFVIADGNGSVVIDEMLALENPDGINPFGVLPFIYITEPDDLTLIPIADDDLIAMQVAICLLLTDLAFASKYQLWSLFVITGVDGSQKLDFNPNSIIQLPSGATLDAVKPDTDIDKALNFIENLVGLLLTTKNLSVGDISGSVKAQGASGVAKMIDRSETTEDRKDQQAIFIDAETRLWDLFSHYMLPYWVQTNQVDPQYVGKFTEDFELSIKFQDPKPYIGDMETVKVEVEKINSGLTTKRLALKAVHPELDNEQVEELEAELLKEKKLSIQNAQMALSSGDQSNDPMMDESYLDQEDSNHESNEQA